MALFFVVSYSFIFIFSVLFVRSSILQLYLVSISEFKLFGGGYEILWQLLARCLVCVILLLLK